MLSNWWEYSMFGVKRNGKIDGNRNIPEKDQLEHAAFEKQLVIRAAKDIRQVAQQWEKSDQSLKSNYVAALRYYFDAQKRARKEADEAEAVLNNHREVCARLKENSDNPHLGKKTYRAIILLIALGEIPLTAKAFNLMGENQLLTYVFALVLCVSVPALAHFAGLIFKEKLDLKNSIILFIDIASFIGVLYVISWVREKYFEAEGQQLLEGVQMDPHMVSFVFFAIQLFIFLVATTASYFAHDSHPERIKTIKESERSDKDVKKETQEAKVAEKQLDEAARQLADAEARREKIFAAYKAQVEEIVESCKMMIQTYRTANVRARGYEGIASFMRFPEISVPACLQDLDKDCGLTVPEITPVRCPLCGEENSGTARLCKGCGGTL
jgi:hypothetical protein